MFYLEYFKMNLRINEWCINLNKWFLNLYGGIFLLFLGKSYFEMNNYFLYIFYIDIFKIKSNWKWKDFVLLVMCFIFY